MRMNSSKFLGELKRRKVYRVAVAYIIAGWALAQGISQVFPIFDIPNWVIRLIVLLIIIGFPFALVLSWFFDLTRYGIIRTPDADSYGQIDISRPASSKEKSIAVLPFTDLSPGVQRDYFGDGIAEEILCALARIDGLRVAARRSSFWFKEKEAELREIARKLNVAHVLEGTVRREKNRVRITAELIDASEGFTIWSETFDREFERIFALQDEITRAIIAALKLKLDIPTTGPATRNTEAYDLYLRAHALGAHSDERSLERQIALLHEALAADPEYTTAWAELACACASIADAYRAPLEVLPTMRHAALMAVKTDEKAGAGHIWLAAVALNYDWNFSLAKAELERAIALDPNSSDARRWYGWYLARIERDFGRARAQMKSARTLDPLYTWPVWWESDIAIAQGDHAAALHFAERVMEIDPDFFYEEDPIAHVYLAMGRWEDALKRYESLPASTFSRPNFELAICYAHTGDTSRGKQILNDLELLAQQRYVDHTHIAAIYAALNDKEKAFAALERAYKDRSARISAPRFYPWLSPLFDNARFAALERTIAKSTITLPAEPRPPDSFI
jgi:serine/threonine-protein kinase